MRSRLHIFVLLAALGLAACGEAPAPIDAAPVGETLLLEGGITRLDLRFPCGTDTCAGWLYLPASEIRPPVAILGSGFAGTRDVGLSYFAERIARAGVAAFAFDYRHFGASGGAPRQLVDAPGQLEDWRSAIAFMRTRGDVDATRLALWGTSLGAGHVLITAAADGKIVAIVGQVPLIDSGAEGEASFPGVWWAVKLVLTGWSDLLSTAFGGEVVTMPAIAPSGGFGMIVDDAAYASYRKIAGRGTTYRNAVAARSPFTFDDYNPRDHVDAIAAPILLIAARGDRFAPFSAVAAYAARAPNVTLETFEGDHFDVYSPPASEFAAETAAAFLKARLSAP